MRIKFKTKVFFLLILIGLCLAAGFYTAYRIFNPSVEASVPWIMPNMNNSTKKFIAKETLINQIQQKHELISLEVDLTEKVIIDDSWGNLELFKKVQNIHFIGRGIYAVDISKLRTQNISIDNAKHTISVTIPKPFIKALTIDEQKTVFETPKNGLLRFGEIKMTPAEYQVMVNHAKLKMTEKLNSSDFLGQSLQNTETAVVKLIKAILEDEGENNYTVLVQFEKEL